MASYKEVGAKITAMIMDAVSKGEKLPWVKPWKGGNNPIAFGAVSYSTGKKYSFINQLMLGGSGEWITFNNVKKLGGMVNKGAKGCIIYKRGSVVKTEIKTDANGEEKEVAKNIMFFKTDLVFNIKDTTLPSKWLKEEEVDAEPIVTSNDIECAEELISKYVETSGVTFLNNINSSRAFYSPNEDKVVVPNKEQFDLMNEYYSTAFHEFVHSTLKSTRCNRPNNGVVFGDKDYAKEELVAELGSCMILASLGISTETTERNSTAYLQNWLGALNDDCGLIVTAASRAEKAMEFILASAEDGEVRETA